MHNIYHETPSVGLPNSAPKATVFDAADVSIPPSPVKTETIEEPRAAQPAAESGSYCSPCLVLSCLVPLFSSFVLNPNHNAPAPAQAPAKDKRGHQI